VFVPLGVLTARDARRRGYNAWFWSITVALSPIVFGLAYLIVRRRRGSMEVARPHPQWNTAFRESVLIPEVLLVLDGVAGVIAFVIVVTDLAVEQPVNGVGFLLAPAIPLLFGAQLWIIVTLNARRPPQLGESSGRRFAQRRRLPEFFGGLSRREGTAVTAGFLLAWLSAMTATPWITNGNPAAGTARCPWRLDDHDIFTCVSHHTYLLAGASVQRFATGILLGFFVVHLGVALSDFRLRRDMEGWSSPIT
jgi:hypothetical protein